MGLPVSEFLLFFRPPANRLTSRDREIQQETQARLLGIKPDFNADFVPLPKAGVMEKSGAKSCGTSPPAADITWQAPQLASGACSQS